MSLTRTELEQIQRWVIVALACCTMGSQELDMPCKKMKESEHSLVTAVTVRQVNIRAERFWCNCWVMGDVVNFNFCFVLVANCFSAYLWWFSFLPVVLCVLVLLTIPRQHYQNFAVFRQHGWWLPHSTLWWLIDCSLL